MFPSVALHMGINSGEAWVGATKIGGAGAQRWTFTATGPTTNLAARFAGSAQGDEIVVGAPTADAHPGLLRAGEPGREELQERVAAAARLPHHPAWGVRQDRVTSALA